MKTEYIVKAFEEECGVNLYKITVPNGISEKEVMKAFKNATQYVQHSWGYFDKIFDNTKIETEELEEIFSNDWSRYIELGKKVFDEHFDKMVEMEEEHRLEIFWYYIENCMGWKIEEITENYDFEFEW